MRTLAAICLALSVSACDANVDTPNASQRSVSGESPEEEAARMACMFSLPDAYTYPSMEAYERALGRCIDDEMRESI